MSIYLITTPSPKNEARDMSVDQDFTAIINGDLATSYRLIIMNNSSGVSLYDTTQTTLTTSLINGDTITITVPASSVSNGLELKWTLQIWENTTTNTELEEIFFYSYDTPTLSQSIATTITEQKYTATATWYQTEGLSCKKFIATLYDEDDEKISDSGLQENGSLSWEFTGFRDDTTYGIGWLAYDEFDRSVSSTISQFNVDYTEPNVNIVPAITSSSETGANILTWGSAVLIEGNETGTITYGDNFLYTGDGSIVLSSSSDAVDWDVSIPEVFGILFTIKITDGFVGTIIELDNGNYIFEYDGNNFNVTIGGITSVVSTTTIAEKKWLICLRPLTVYIREVS